ncbi:MAG: hypothetical protein V1889_00330 [archaeon]
MKTDGDLEVFSIMIVIILVIVTATFMFYFGIGNIQMRMAGYVIIEFPNSSSNILSEFEKTYKANEEAILKLEITNETKIKSIQIDGINVDYEYRGNETIVFPLDTSIDNKESREIKLISIYGNVINEGNFTQKDNYEVVMSTEEFLLQKTKNVEKIAMRANRYSLLAILISISVFFIDQIINYYFKSKKPKPKKRRKSKK